MGTYSTEEFLETFGGLPEPGDPQWAGPDPDRMRDELRERDREESTDARRAARDE